MALRVTMCRRQGLRLWGGALFFFTLTGGARMRAIEPLRTRAPRGTVHSVEDVAAMLSVPVHRVVWHCDRADAAGAASFFFGVWKEDGKWVIPDRVLRRAIGGIAMQHYTVQEVAEIVSMDAGTIRRRLWIVPKGMGFDRVPGHLIGARKMLGSGPKADVRIPHSELEKLCAGLADCPGEDAA